MFKDYSFKSGHFGNIKGFKGFDALYWGRLTNEQLLETLKLRNEVRIRRTSVNTAKIPLRAHLDFARDGSKEHCYYAFYEGGVFKGVCALSRIKGKDCFLALYAKERYAYGYLILKAGEEIAKDLGIQNVFLRVRRGNLHAQHFFKRADYSQAGFDPSFFLYHKIL